MTVQGTPASVTAANAFSVSLPVATGTTTIAVAATDASGNTATKQYEIDSVGVGRTLTYDANGNLTADGTRTFEWSARNQWWRSMLARIAVNLRTTESSGACASSRRRTASLSPM